MKLDQYRFEGKGKFSLSEHSTKNTDIYSNKNQAREKMQENLDSLMKLQDKLYADNRYAILLIIQAMDAAGKDGIVKHVMSGLNPQGTQVFSFKQPSSEELDHDYLWRCMKALPERGRIGIFNRSYYEDVLVVRVHDLVKHSQLPHALQTEDIWNLRYRQMRDFETYLVENGILPVKIFLHLSKEEQKERFLARIEDPTKNWKFSAADVKERGYWDSYQKYYEEAIQHTSTKLSPWHIVPADKKWFSRLLVSEILLEKLQGLDLDYPVLAEDQMARLQEAKAMLLVEK